MRPPGRPKTTHRMLHPCGIRRWSARNNTWGRLSSRQLMARRIRRTCQHVCSFRARSILHGLSAVEPGNLFYLPRLVDVAWLFGDKR